MADSPQIPGLPPQYSSQVYTFSEKRITYRTLLFNVFFHPKLAMALFAMINRYWLLSLCTLLMLCMVGGCGLAVSRVPDYASDIRQSTDFLLETVGTIQVHQGLLEWEEPPAGTLPARHRCPHLRVDIVEKRTDFNPHDLTEGERAGIVVAHDGLRFWRRLADSENAADSMPEATIPPRLLQSLSESQAQLQAAEGNDGKPAAGGSLPLTLSRKTQGQICKLVFLSLFVALMVEHTLEIGMAILSSVLIMVVTIAFIIRIRKIRSFFALLLFALNAIIPPAIGATIYRIAEVGSDFHSLLVIMTGIYFIYALIEGRKGTVIFPPDSL